MNCAKAFDAGLSGKPVGILSNNDGCVISRSEEAKQIGTSMGALLFKIEPWLDEVVTIFVLFHASGYW